jgi:cell division septum initiation protein DivIVA
MSNPDSGHARVLSPGAIRGQTFRRKVWGLDEVEVRDCLDRLADQVQVADGERAELRVAVGWLTARVNQRGGKTADPEDVTPQTVALFSQAQQVADQLIDEAVRHARDLMLAARQQQRDLLTEAHGAAERAAGAAADHLVATVGEHGSSREVEYVRTFAQVAQVQLRSVLEALAEQVDKLDAAAATPEVGVADPAPRPQVGSVFGGRGPSGD